MDMINPDAATEGPVKANPYPWPFDGDLRPDNTALIIIDMQTDFCGPGGYVDAMGYDLSLTRAPIGPIKTVLAAMRPSKRNVLRSCLATISSPNRIKPRMAVGAVYKIVIFHSSISDHQRSGPG